MSDVDRQLLLGLKKERDRYKAALESVLERLETSEIDDVAAYVRCELQNKAAPRPKKSQKVLATVETYGWLGPKRLKFINENPKVVSLLYDLGLLPEEISARMRGYVEDERKRCAKIVDGWHFKKGGYTELAAKIREGGS